MPQIEIPFTPGQRVRTKDGYEFEVAKMLHTNRHGWLYADDFCEKWYDTSELTLVEPVIEWERRQEESWRAAGWVGGAWEVFGSGALWYGARYIGTFPSPRAVAEATQKMWNEARKG